MDLAFMDGDRGHEGVKGDTELAFAFRSTPLRARRGVYAYLSFLAVQGELKLYQIARTYLVVGQRDWRRDITSTIHQPGDSGDITAKRITRLAEF